MYTAEIYRTNPCIQTDSSLVFVVHGRDIRRGTFLCIEQHINWKVNLSSLYMWTLMLGGTLYYSLDTNFMMHSISFVCTECTCILIIAPASYEAVSGSQVQEASGRKTLPRQEETGTGSSNDLWPSRGYVQNISNVIKLSCGNQQTYIHCIKFLKIESTSVYPLSAGCKASINW